MGDYDEDRWIQMDPKNTGLTSCNFARSSTEMLILQDITRFLLNSLFSGSVLFISRHKFEIASFPSEKITSLNFMLKFLLLYKR